MVGICHKSPLYLAGHGWARGLQYIIVAYPAAAGPQRGQKINLQGTRLRVDKKFVLIFVSNLATNHSGS